MIESVNNILGFALMAVLAACGIWFTLKMKGVQL